MLHRDQIVGRYLWQLTDGALEVEIQDWYPQVRLLKHPVSDLLAGCWQFWVWHVPQMVTNDGHGGIWVSALLITCTCTIARAKALSDSQ